jgi:hypothetical protein
MPPYKQDVGGSSPSLPTNCLSNYIQLDLNYIQFDLTLDPATVDAATPQADAGGPDPSNTWLPTIEDGVTFVSLRNSLDLSAAARPLDPQDDPPPSSASQRSPREHV